MSKRNREHKRQRKAGKEGVESCLMWVIFENSIIQSKGFNGVPGCGLDKFLWFPDFSTTGEVGKNCFETEAEAKAVLKATLLEALKKLE